MNKRYILLMPLFLMAISSVYADDPREIISQVIDRNDGDAQYDRQTIATCKYQIKGNKLKCTERPRIKVFEAVRKDYGERGRDHKSIMIILQPSSEKGISFLQYDYDEQGKETNQWMYLSALGKIKRIVSGDEDEPKKGTLFGSEFGYEDIEQVHIDDFTYKLLREEEYSGRNCWVIESIPTEAHARKSNYSRFEQWIDKERFIILKNKIYDRSGKLKKQLTVSNLTKINDIWVAKKLNMNNIQDKRISTIKLDNISLNIPVDDELLQQRTLTDGAFRESKLSELRKNTAR